MKTYIVYVDGIKVGMIKAGNHNAAEKKAKQLTLNIQRQIGERLNYCGRISISISISSDGELISCLKSNLL